MQSRLVPPFGPPLEAVPDSGERSAECVPDGARVVLTGPLARELRLGPPGYRETPAEDERDSITVVVLPHPVVLCGTGTGTAADSAVHVRRVQIMGLGPSRNAQVGSQATVYGRLARAVFGVHYTPAVIYMDSVVAPGPRGLSGRA